MTTTAIQLVTGNPNKLADIRAILAPSGISVESHAIDLIEIQGTIEEISIAKCREAAEIVRKPIWKALDACAVLIPVLIDWRPCHHRRYRVVL